MKDRVPVNPGRVLITPENGSAAYYATMTRADNPTQEGDPLNKNTLLKDATAAKFGLGNTAVPDDVLGVLSRLHSGLANEYVWEKYGPVEEKYVAESGSTKSIRVYSSGGTPLYTSLTYATGAEVSADGTIQLTGIFTPTKPTNSASSNHLYWDEFLPFYIKWTDGTLYKVTKRTYADSNYIDWNCVGVAAGTRTVTKFMGYVNSTNPNAYPVDDGYTYELLGQLGSAFGGVQIETGSYVGTNTYGVSNKSSITFGFTPKVWGIYAERNNGEARTWSFVWSMNPWDESLTSATIHKPSSTGISASYLSTVQYSGNTVSWYSTSAMYQLNDSGKIFYYFAIG